MLIGVCQTPEILGDVAAARDLVHDVARQAAGVDLLVFPECFLQGYQPTPEHVRRHAMRCADVRLDVPGTVVLGMIERDGDRFYNSAAVFAGGCYLGAYRKTFLTRGERVFTAGGAYPVFRAGGTTFGVNICFDGRYPHAAAAIARQGATLLAFPAQNMMRREKAYEWQEKHNALRRRRVAETGLWLASADVTGERGTTHLGLGPTCVMNPAGQIVAEVPPGTVGVATAEIH
ncbi:hypothetical protein Aab01nite_13170 [Paractinoplanes abujensis]|uniref:Putative amidohydrolase n=1 Tax=Paractinoplanes abujensis TaxID=882441 RepID=A0A7W7CPF1_9ACTN|nr:carbon-nitrogen hydrolase family protein [Actinoplanes abujensis]MBB4690860.1 putative amidohydrolase [Actinoplanes abujensis]GID17727.1 hypothetical protein Aab01nite_13170 [Actinoplanes abujensis]